MTGCGDGGLIDCLRIIHGHFRDGWLAVELAEMLGTNHAIKDKIETAEHDALTAARSIACMPPLAGKIRPAARVAAEALRSQKYTEALAAAYHDVVEQLPADARKLLDNSIAASGMQPQRVKLVAREPKPFVPYSAPIHKLMIAHALQKLYVQYEAGEVDYQRGVARVIRRDNPRPYKVPNALLVVRHGAGANLIGPIGADELTSLKIRQLLMADYIDRDTERTIAPPTVRFISSRYGMAKALVRQIAPHMRLTADGRGYRYVKTEETAAALDAPPPLRLQLPAKLFGIEAREDPDDADHCLL